MRVREELREVDSGAIDGVASVAVMHYVGQ